VWRVETCVEPSAYTKNAVVVVVPMQVAVAALAVGVSNAAVAVAFAHPAAVRYFRSSEVKTLPLPAAS
jgi:hypothetical protein